MSPKFLIPHVTLEIRGGKTALNFYCRSLESGETRSSIDVVAKLILFVKIRSLLKSKDVQLNIKK